MKGIGWFEPVSLVSSQLSNHISSSFFSYILFSKKHITTIIAIVAISVARVSSLNAPFRSSVLRSVGHTCSTVSTSLLLL